MVDGLLIAVSSSRDACQWCSGSIEAGKETAPPWQWSRAQCEGKAEIEPEKRVIRSRENSLEMVVIGPLLESNQWHEKQSLHLHVCS